MELPATADGVAGQENERPRIHREPLSPVQDLGSFRAPATIGASLDLNLLDIPDPFSYANPDVINAGQGAGHTQGQDSSMPDTLDWGTFLGSQPGHHGSLPPIPSQCLMPSRPPSTASSSQARYLRPFAGKGLHTLSGVSGAKARDPLMDCIAEADCVIKAADASRSSTLPGPNDAGDTRSSVTMTGMSGEAFQHLSKTVHGHEQRLDRLENVSFSVAGHEECQDKHDNTDLRVTELESRVEEVEKILNNDNSSLGSARRFFRRDLADDATASVVSVSTNGADRTEMYSQLQALQAQVSHLQATTAPSYNNPWELEVVFLPFPLKGIWLGAHEFPVTTQAEAPGGSADGWTQMPNTASRSVPDPRSPAAGPDSGELRGPDWLLPRACAPGRMVDKRLRSRGLVKTIAIKAPDARAIQVAINAAFTDVLRMSAFDVASRALVRRAGHDIDPPLSTALGLQQPWVPLRKVHKDSRLRFLASSELVTPALWDYSFLTSSVVMKASGMQRLYITQREAYLQDHLIGHQAFESGWTWQKLRTLTRVYPDSQSSNGDVPEADALEECWTWNDRLDEPPSSRPSSASIRPAQANRSWGRLSSTSPSQQYFTGVQSPLLPNSPVAVRAQSPFVLKDRKGGRPDHVRTNSLPPATPLLISTSVGKRRVSSNAITAANHPYERRSSPLMPRASPRVQTTSATAASGNNFIKRRYSTRSPSLLPRNTPRWSQGNVSRSPSVAPLGAQGFGDDRSERRTTPFCYATPYSNAPMETNGYMRANSRGPVQQPNGYNVDDDDEMDDEHGSSTDPYDSEATNEVDDAELGNDYQDNLARQNTDDDGDIDIDVYEDEADDLNDVDTDGDDSHQAQQWHNGTGATRHLAQQEHAHGQAYAAGNTLPEDEPWPGIEDRMSDGENVDPQSASTDEVDIEINDALVGHGGDAASDASSQPSEYPSTQRAWHVTHEAGPPEGRGLGGAQGQDREVGHGEADSGVGFRIHEDVDTDIDGVESQWP